MTLTSEGVTPLAERYRDRLPLAADAKIVSLGEGSTPLLPAPRLSERTGAEVWLKWEGANPTGSFKDRGMTVAVTQALADGARSVVCASTGNTAARRRVRGSCGPDAVNPAGRRGRARQAAQARRRGEGRPRANWRYRRRRSKRRGRMSCQLAHPAPPPGRDGSIRDRREPVARPMSRAPRRAGPLRLRLASGARHASPLCRRQADDRAGPQHPRSGSSSPRTSGAAPGRLGRRGAVDPTGILDAWRLRPRRGPLRRAPVCRRTGGPSPDPPRGAKVVCVITRRLRTDAVAKSRARRRRRTSPVDRVAAALDL